ncbi:MAG: hypothetical protein AAFO15_01120 [Pseudomonadota bacterium]
MVNYLVKKFDLEVNDPISYQKFNPDSEFEFCFNILIRREGRLLQSGSFMGH